MEIELAIKLVRALVTGVHPESGAALNEGSVCRTPETVQALNRALAALVAQQEREKNGPRTQPSAGRMKKMRKSATNRVRGSISIGLPTLTTEVWLRFSQGW